MLLEIFGQVNKNKKLRNIAKGVLVMLIVILQKELMSGLVSVSHRSYSNQGWAIARLL